MDRGRRRDRRREVGRLTVDEHVDVAAQTGPLLDEAVAHPGSCLVERSKDLVHARSVEDVSSLDAREQRQQGTRQQDGRHGLDG